MAALLCGACTPETADDVVDTDGAVVPGIAALRVHPATFALYEDGAARYLRVEALDASGRSLGDLDAAQVTWGSSDPEAVVIDAQGRATAEAGTGAVRLTALGPDGATGEAFALRATLRDGVKVVSDEDVRGETTLVEGGAARIGATWAFVHGGDPLTAGDLIVADGEAPVAGRVVDVARTAAGQRVQVRVPPMTDLLSEPQALSLGVRPHTSMDPLDVTLTCGGDPSGDGPAVEVRSFAIAGELTLHVDVGAAPSAVVDGALRVRLDATLSGALDAGPAPCRSELGRLPVGPTAGVLAPLLRADLVVGVGATLEGRLGLPEARPRLTVDLDQEADLEAGLRCSAGTCTGQGVMEVAATQERYLLEDVSDAVPSTDGAFELFAWTAVELLPPAGEGSNLGEVRAGARVGLVRAPDDGTWLLEPELRDDATLDALTTVGPSAWGAALPGSAAGWLGATTADEGAAGEAWAVRSVPWERLPLGRTRTEGPEEDGSWRLVIDLLRSRWNGAELVGRVQWMLEGEAGWTPIADAPLDGASSLEVRWTPPEPLDASQRVVALLDLGAPFDWQVEAAPSGIAFIGRSPGCTPGELMQQPVLGRIVCVPGGTFVMGCVPGRDDVDGGCTPPEFPAHAVTITRPYWVMERHVTQAQFVAMLGENPSFWADVDEDLPVENVSWPLAVAFADAVSRASGLVPCGTGHPYACDGWRLPTEAELEWAARGGEDHAYPGTDDPRMVSWFDENTRPVRDPRTGATSCAGTACTQLGCRLDRNAFGLCDMTGNVEQWAYDWHTAYGPEALFDPVGPVTGLYRATRGGSWGQPRQELRVAYRMWGSPDYHSDATGVRLVRSLP